ncbi:cobalt transporter, partial [Escherichia coli]|nr:cobalt transporter [Escherichia coli]
NKDGKLSWRPLQLIHPVLYVNLVNIITKKENWEKITSRFIKFRSNNQIECLSIPVIGNDEKDKAAQVSEWWQKVELRS